MLQFRNRDALSSNIVSCRPIRLKLDGCTSLESHALEGQGHCALPKVQNPGSPHLAATIPQQTNELARIWVIGKCISHAQFRSNYTTQPYAPGTDGSSCGLGVNRSSPIVSTEDTMLPKKRAYTCPLGVRVQLASVELTGAMGPYWVGSGGKHTACARPSQLVS